MRHRTLRRTLRKQSNPSNGPTVLSSLLQSPYPIGYPYLPFPSTEASYIRNESMGGIWDKAKDARTDASAYLAPTFDLWCGVPFFTHSFANMLQSRGWLPNLNSAVKVIIDSPSGYALHALEFLACKAEINTERDLAPRICSSRNESSPVK